jgi:hypothetical protein
MSKVEKLNNLSTSSAVKSPSEALVEEKKHLWKYPGEMECYLMSSLKIDKYATFSYGTNRYSVPDYLVGRMVDVKVYAGRLKVYHNNLHLYTHIRNYGVYQWQLDIDHYLITLSRKPGAVHGSVALEQSPASIRLIYQRFFESDPRGFIDILLYCKKGGIDHEKLEDAVDKLCRICPGDISADKVIALLGNQSDASTLSPPQAKKTDEIEDLSLRQLQEITLMAESRIN